MFVRAFTAPSLSAFWRYWNPGYGFFLLFYFYKPIRQFCPHSIAVVLTFLTCGFVLHDTVYLIPILLRDGTFSFPFITVWFALIAIGVVITDRFGVQFNRLPRLARTPIHTGFILSTFLLTRYLDTAWG